MFKLRLKLIHKICPQEAVGQTVVGLLGIAGNVMAIAIYWTSGNKFYTIFYRLLVPMLRSFQPINVYPCTLPTIHHTNF
jgi:hypothetical protein